MTAYKIIYGSYSRVNKKEFNWHGEWTRFIYKTKEQCQKEMDELIAKHPKYTFKMKELSIKEVKN